MEETGTPLADYIQLFQKRRRDLWGEEKKPDDYHATVDITWSLALDQIKEEAPAAEDLLNLCAFLTPDDIPWSLIVGEEEDLPDSLKGLATNPLVLNRALRALKRFSLVERGEDNLSVHRLVQAVVRDRLDQGSREKWASTAIDLLNPGFPADMQVNVKAWPLCSRLLPHALAALERAGELNWVIEGAGRLWNQVGFYLQIRAEFRQTQTCFERALQIAEAICGPEHPKVAIRVNNLGSALYDKGDLEGAKDCFERALRIDEAVYGKEHPHVAIDVNNLGLVLKNLGDLAGAKECHERALTILEKAKGIEHPQVATAVNNLGSVLYAQGDLEGAKDCFERALRIDEAAYGSEHPKVAIRVNNLGSVLKNLGDLAGAKECYERALRIDEAVYGPEHPDVAIDVNNLGLVLKAHGDLAGAKACFERALKIRLKFLGPDHPDTLLVRSNLESLGG